MKTPVQSTVYIDRQPQEVAKVILDPNKAVLWNSGLERFEVLSEKPRYVGSRSRLHYI